MFMCISFGRQFSGGLYNPSVVVFRMLRKTDRLTLKTGFVYLFFQFSGGAVGCFIGTKFNYYSFLDR